MCFIFFQEKSLGFDRKEDFNNKFKEDWRSEEAPSIKESKAAENSNWHGRATGPHGPAAASPACAVSRFSAYLVQFLFSIRGAFWAAF